MRNTGTGVVGESDRPKTRNVSFGAGAMPKARSLPPKSKLATPAVPNFGSSSPALNILRASTGSQKRFNAVIGIVLAVGGFVASRTAEDLVHARTAEELV